MVAVVERRTSMQFHDLLRTLRKVRGLTQEELAEKSGIPISSLRNHEQGHRLPNFFHIVRLARALGVSVDEFANCEEPAGTQETPPRPSGKRK